MLCGCEQNGLWGWQVVSVRYSKAAERPPKPSLHTLIGYEQTGVHTQPQSRNTAPSAHWAPPNTHLQLVVSGPTHAVPVAMTDVALAGQEPVQLLINVTGACEGAQWQVDAIHKGVSSLFCAMAGLTPAAGTHRPPHSKSCYSTRPPSATEPPLATYPSAC